MLLRSRHHLTTAAAAAALIATAVSGCGGGGSSHLSHAKLVSEANAACRQANAQVAKLGTPAASVPALAKYAGQVLPVSRRLVTKLSALDAGSADAAALKRYTAALQAGNRGLTQMHNATSPSEIQRAGQLISAQQIKQLATRLGASNCGAAPSA